MEDWSRDTGAWVSPPSALGPARRRCLLGLACPWAPTGSLLSAGAGKCLQKRPGSRAEPCGPALEMPGSRGWWRIPGPQKWGAGGGPGLWEALWDPAQGSPQRRQAPGHQACSDLQPRVSSGTPCLGSWAGCPLELAWVCRMPLGPGLAVPGSSSSGLSRYCCWSFQRTHPKGRHPSQGGEAPSRGPGETETEPLERSPIAKMPSGKQELSASRSPCPGSVYLTVLSLSAPTLRV